MLTSLLNRFPFLVYAGAGLLIYLAVEMLFADKVTHPYLKHYESIEWIIGAAAAVILCRGLAVGAKIEQRGAG